MKSNRSPTLPTYCRSTAQLSGLGSLGFTKLGRCLDGKGRTKEALRRFARLYPLALTTRHPLPLSPAIPFFYLYMYYIFSVCFRGGTPAGNSPCLSIRTLSLFFILEAGKSGCILGWRMTWTKDAYITI